MTNVVTIIGYALIAVFVGALLFHATCGYSVVSGMNWLLERSQSLQWYFDTDFAWCQMLRNHYKTIRDEYIEYVTHKRLHRVADFDSTQAVLDFAEIPWNAALLRVYNADTNLVKHFPKTSEILSQIPNCTTAMFSELPPGKHLAPHKGIYKGVLRYHLGLIVPQPHTACTLVVNHTPYHWQEGRDVMFDDRFLHEAKNDSSEPRVVLLLDIKRTFDSVLLNLLNDAFLRLSKNHNEVLSIVKNVNTVTPVQVSGASVTNELKKKKVGVKTNIV